eukprot:7192644-Pyramimonas_sp.AAC.1
MRQSTRMERGVNKHLAAEGRVALVFHAAQHGALGREGLEKDRPVTLKFLCAKNRGSSRSASDGNSSSVPRRHAG